NGYQFNAAHAGAGLRRVHLVHGEIRLAPAVQRHRREAEADRRRAGSGRARQAGLCPGREARGGGGERSEDPRNRNRDSRRKAAERDDRACEGRSARRGGEGQGDEARRARAGNRARQGSAAQPGGRPGGCRRGEDSAPRSRRQSACRSAVGDPAGTLMAELTTIARPYAEAAFELAQEQNALPVWSEMLRFAASVAGDPRVSAALDNPRLNDAQKESLFLTICGEKLDTAGRNFIRVLLEAGRIKLLPQIRDIFDSLKDDVEG